MKDISIVLVLMLLLAAGFYAFQVLILILVGIVLYYLLPNIKKLLRRRSKWK